MKQSIIISLVFFIFGLLTLSHYGINWDTINHLPRGQAYLYFFLTGQQDYHDLPKFERYFQDPGKLTVGKDQADKIKRSIYQLDNIDYRDYILHDGAGHPPLSDILSSALNLILFQKLKIINDIDSYRVYGIFLAASLVGLIFWWASKIYGRFAGSMAVLALATYPLFWAESHFNNEKDTPETVFWSFFIFSIWKGVTEKKWRWLTASGILFGLALGTKFNIIFSVFVIVPWLLIFYIGEIKRNKSLHNVIRENKLVIANLFLIPLIGTGLFFLTWPYLWSDPVAGFLKMLGFYKGIGITTSVDPHFITHFGFNLYPIKAIFYTTPLITLFFVGVGLLASLPILFKQREKLNLLFFLWLIVPIIRVSWPGATIYGGVRQIMEYVPPLAFFTGVGADYLITKFSKILVSKQSPTSKYLNIKTLKIVCFLLLGYLVLLPIRQYHPNENVYFNELIGGLKGAKEKNFPFWGNSFGSAYRQGVIWLNKNAKPNAKVAFARELLPNIPNIWLREDLDLHNTHRSGYQRGGEYIIALIYQGVENTSYFDRYLAKELKPVYTVDVDGVSILKIWENSDVFLLPQYKNEVKLDDYKIEKKEDRVRFEFNKIITLSRIQANFDTSSCTELKNGYVLISTDGTNWEKLPGNMPKEDWSVPKIGDQPQKNSVLVPFAGDRVRFVDLVVIPPDSCLKNILDTKVRYFPDI